MLEIYIYIYIYIDIYIYIYIYAPCLSKINYSIFGGGKRREHIKFSACFDIFSIFKNKK